MITDYESRKVKVNTGRSSIYSSKIKTSGGSYR